MKRDPIRRAALAAALALALPGLAACDQGPVEEPAAPPSIQVSLEGLDLLDLRVVDGEVVPCRIGGLAFEACDRPASTQGPWQVVQLASEDGGGFGFLEGFGSGGGGPSYGTGISVVPAYSAVVATSAALSLAFAGTVAYGVPASVQAFFDAQVAGGACNPVVDLCNFTVAVASLAPGGGGLSTSQCISEASVALSDPAFASFVTSEFFCRVIAFLSCMVPAIQASYDLFESGDIANPEQASGVVLATFFQCSALLPALIVSDGSSFE